MKSVILIKYLYLNQFFFRRGKLNRVSEHSKIDLAKKKKELIDHVKKIRAKRILSEEENEAIGQCVQGLIPFRYIYYRAKHPDFFSYLCIF